MTPSAKAKTLMHTAIDALRTAYAPYSRLRVGAAIVTKAGNIYRGCNVEIASYPVGMCAERNAIGAAVQAEGTAMEIDTIAIAAIDEKNNQVPLPPCGACRQAISEFGKDATVVFVDIDHALSAKSLKTLLPHAFPTHRML